MDHPRTSLKKRSSTLRRTNYAENKLKNSMSTVNRKFVDSALNSVTSLTSREAATGQSSLIPNRKYLNSESSMHDIKENQVLGLNDRTNRMMSSMKRRATFTRAPGKGGFGLKHRSTCRGLNKIEERNRGFGSCSYICGFLIVFCVGLNLMVIYFIVKWYFI